MYRLHGYRQSSFPGGWSGLATEEGFECKQESFRRYVVRFNNWVGQTSFSFECKQASRDMLTKSQTNYHLDGTSACGASSTGQVGLVATWKYQKRKLCFHPTKESQLKKFTSSLDQTKCVQTKQRKPTKCAKNVSSSDQTKKPTSSLDETSRRFCKLPFLSLLLGCKIVLLNKSDRFKSYMKLHT